VRYAQFLQWVDGEFNPPFGVRYSLPLLVSLGWVPALAFDHHTFTVVAAALWSGAWLGLFGWRFVVWTRKGDREYDRRIKFCLPKEYHKTESATSAAERRRRAEKRAEGNTRKE
jgi:hypothetical protein